MAGSDSSGGAGIQADLKTIEACGGWGATVITAITAQNTLGVARQARIAPEIIRAQIEAVLEDLRVASIKIGMLSDGTAAAVVARAIDSTGARPIVCDPVVFASSGARLLDDEGLAVLRDRILGRVTLVTPNAAEAELLTGRPVRTIEDAARAGEDLVALGAGAALVTGGHLEGPRAVDVLVEPGRVTRFDGERLARVAAHGTGCVLSAAIATHLARGRDLADAVDRSKRFVTDAIRGRCAIGHGNAAVDPLHAWHAALGAGP